MTEDLATQLGISAGEPGFACVRIAPDLKLRQSVNGVLALPIGEVTVIWSLNEGDFQLEVEVPTGIHLQVRLPASPDDALLIDGEPISDDTQTVRTDEFVELAVLPGSRYKFEVKHS